MVKKCLILTIGVIALTILSCADEKSTESQQSKSTNVTFSSKITRVTGNSFDIGDVISVVAFDSSGDMYGDVASYTHGGENFESADPIVLEYGSALSYVATYPALGEIGSTFDFTIQTDQSTADDYEDSDLLTALVEETSSSNPTLQFCHVMSSLEVTFVVTNDEGTVSNPLISDFTIWALNSANCDIKTASYTGTGSKAIIIPLTITSGSKYAAIIAPQSVATSTYLASVTVDGVTYTWITVKNIKFASGFKYEYTWNIDSRSQTSDVVFSGDIIDWGEGSIDGDGDSSTEDPSIDSTQTDILPNVNDSTTDESVPSVATTIWATDFGLSNNAVLTTLTSDVYTFDFATSSEYFTPVFYTSSSAFHLNNSSTFTVSSSNGNMSNITFELSGGSLISDVGSMSSDSWSGNSATVVFSTPELTQIKSITIE